MSTEQEKTDGWLMGAALQRFEDLIAWQKARILAAEVYRVTETGRIAKDYGLRDQMRRAAVSIMYNIAEGFERGRMSEFHQFLSVAKGSCAELRSQLYLALDARLVDRPAFDRLFALTTEVGRIIGGLRASVGRRRDNSHAEVA